MWNQEETEPAGHKAGVSMSSGPNSLNASPYGRIGKYDILSHVAAGGTAAVYKALDTECNRVVALKVLAPMWSAHPIQLERFRREAQHSARLHHSNIVALYE